MTHTPGPWTWMDYPDGRKLLLSRDRAVIHCPDAPMTCDPPDARLIAAAPELLAALQNVVDSAVTDSDTCPLCRADVSRHAPDCAVVVATAAIAKAEA